MLYFYILLQGICTHAYTCAPIIQGNPTIFTLMQIDVTTDIPNSTPVYLSYKKTTVYYTSSLASSGKAVFKVYLFKTGTWDFSFSCSGSVTKISRSVGDLTLSLNFPVVPTDTGISYDLDASIDLTDITLAAELVCTLSVTDNFGNGLNSKISGSSLTATLINGKCDYNFTFSTVETYKFSLAVSESCTSLVLPLANAVAQITNPITSVQITTVNSMIFPYSVVEYTVSVFKGANVTFTDNCLINLKIKNSTYTFFEDNQVIATGSLVIPVSITVVADLILTVTATSQLVPTNTMSDSIPFIVHPLNFSMSVFTSNNTLPVLSTQEFSIAIITVDYNNIKIDNTLPPITARISLTAPSGKNSGLTIYDGASNHPSGVFTNTLIKGEVTLTGIKILSSGNFKLTIDSDFSPQIIPVSLNLNINNNIILIEEVFPSEIPKISNYFKIDLIYKLIGEDSNPYLLSSTIDLLDSISSMIGATNSTKIPVNGIFILSGVSFRTDGIKIITATVRGTSLNVVHQVHVTKSKLMVSFTTALPFTSSDLFSFIVSVKDTDLLANDLLYNPHLITLSLDSEGEPGVFEGPSSVSTSVHGTAEFLHNKIISAGFFKIRISSPNLEPWISTPISIKFVSANIKYSQTQLVQAKNSLFSFNVTVLELNGSPYLYYTILSLTCSNSSDVYFINQAITTSNSTASFYLSFLSEGIKPCTITSSNSTNLNLTFNISPDLINLDEKCFIGLRKETCFKCIPQAVLSGGVCSCVKFSTYNEMNKTCNCESGMSVYEGMCTRIGNYFSSEEITSYFSEDYKSVILKFARPINQTLGGICNDALILPESLNNLKYNCLLADLHTMQVEFNSIIPPNELNISINPLQIQAIGSQISYNLNPLTAVIKMKYDLPLPLSSIIGPSLISNKCNANRLTLKSKYIIPEYTYRWSVLPKSSLSPYLSTQRSPSLTLDSDMLIVGNFTFKLTVTNTLYNTSAESNLSVNITDKEAILIEITSGTNINVHSYDSLYLKASLLNTCNRSNSFIYTWSYSSNPSDSKFDFNTMTNANQNKIFLSVGKGSLQPKSVYTFSVKVRSGNLIGSASIVLNVISSDLVVELSRSSGIVGIQADFVINFYVFDPDYECSNKDIQFAWYCYENENLCAGSDDSGLELIEYPTALVVPKGKLRDKAYYTFKIIASCSVKTNKISSSIDIYIDKNKLGDIRIKSILDPILSTEDTTIIPSLTPLDKPRFLWTINPSAYIYDTSQPILFIPANTLISGTIYKITLIMYSVNKEDGVSAYTYLPVKPVPICDKLEISSIKNSEKFRFNAANCQNSDPLNVLSFIFGYKKNSEFIWLTKPILSNPIDLLTSFYDHLGIVKVCNSDNSCNNYTATIPKTETRALNISSYADQTYDPEYIPSSIIYYSNFITTNEELNYLYDSYSDFYNIDEKNDLYLDTLLDTTNALLNNTYALESKSSTIIEGTTNYLINILKNYTKTITYDQYTKLFKILTISNDEREPSLVLIVLTLLSDINMKLKPLNYTLNYSAKNITVYTYRNQGSDSNNETIKVNNDTIIINNVYTENTTIYDIQYITYSNQDQSFNLSYNQEGSYHKYNYQPHSSKEKVNNTNDTSIIVSIEGPFDVDLNYDCMTHDGYDWVFEGCSIVSVNFTVVVVLLDYFAPCRILEVFGECLTGLGPVFIALSMLVLCGILGVYTRVADENVRNWKSDKWLLVIYPLTSICVSQPKYRRSFIVFQLFSGQLLVLTFIGGSYYINESVDKYKSTNLNKYSEIQLIRGLFGWILAQLINFPIFFFNVKFIKNDGYHLIALPMNIIITITCFNAIIVLNSSYCSVWSNYWSISYLIFLIPELFIQLFYAKIMLHLFGFKKISDDSCWKNKEVDQSEMKDSRIEDKLDISLDKSNYEHMDEGLSLCKNRPWSLIESKEFTHKKEPNNKSKEIRMAGDSSILSEYCYKIVD